MSSSARPQETLAPLGDRLGMSVDSRFRKEDLDGLVQAIEAVDGIVLVAWEHHLIPALASKLVDDASGLPGLWPDDRYDVVWVVEDLGSGKGRRLREVPELLLAGDQPVGIASVAVP